MPGRKVYVVGVGMTKVSRKIIFWGQLGPILKAGAGEKRTKHIRDLLLNVCTESSTSVDIQRCLGLLPMIFTHILPMMGELSSFSRTIFRYQVIDIAPASNGQNGSKFLIDFLKCLRNRYYECTCSVLPRQSNNLFLQYLQSLNSNFFFQISYRKLQHNLILGLWPAPGCTLIISKISSVYFSNSTF